VQVGLNPLAPTLAAGTGDATAAAVAPDMADAAAGTLGYDEPALHGDDSTVPSGEAVLFDAPRRAEHAEAAAQMTEATAYADAPTAATREEEAVAVR
jgi:hypothetical protein